MTIIIFTLSGLKYFYALRSPKYVMPIKPLFAGILLITFFVYSFIVYTKGTETGSGKMNTMAIKGKLLFQDHNCAACHQVYGLGGYSGPELTYAISDPAKGENFCRAIIKSGTASMPQFNFSDAEINQLIEYLKYIDQTNKSITASRLNN